MKSGHFEFWLCFVLWAELSSFPSQLPEVFSRRGRVLFRAMAMDAVMEEPEDPATFADLSVIFAVCAGKAGRCGIAYVDLEDAERVLCVADVMDPDFTQLERGTTAD